MGEPVDDVIVALLDLLGPPAGADGGRLGTAAGVQGWRLFDGPPLAGFEESDAVAVGLAAEEIAGATGETRRGIAGSHAEQFDLRCIAQSWSGEVDMSGVRVRVYGGFRAVRDVLVANRTLGGVCEWARVVRHTYRPVQTDAGASALIEFAVRVNSTRFD